MPEPTEHQLELRNELIRELERLIVGTNLGTMPIVNASLFFNGNDDDASIAANAGTKRRGKSHSGM
ncbi:hypothetical protein [Rhodopirellula sp. P2]|uniref:hypothetical protein n=1 Tax=Rhodopirellula sp. P2 TaxID=2127060 RepID=UPI002368C5B9|nr:hypothetical protein [Rhodopirellula sp. P2]WDQ19349.1 hypothetical protein PSR62_12650 [Rhodopirellula sp. P2]